MHEFVAHEIESVHQEALKYTEALMIVQDFEMDYDERWVIMDAMHSARETYIAIDVDIPRIASAMRGRIIANGNL